MVIHPGKRVFLYRSNDGTKNPVPGIVTQAYPEQPGLFDIETFHSPRSSSYHVTPQLAVPFAVDVKEMRQHFAKGARMVCGPCNGDDPQPFVDEGVVFVDSDPKGLREAIENSPDGPVVAIPNPRRPAPRGKPAGTPAK